MIDLGEWLCATYRIPGLLAGLCWPLAHAWLAYRAHVERERGRDALGPDLALADLVDQLESNPDFAGLS